MKRITTNILGRIKTLKKYLTKNQREGIKAKRRRMFSNVIVISSTAGSDTHRY